jgi:hypothetical protein
MRKILSFFRTAGLLGGGSMILATILFVVSVVEQFKDRNVPAYWLLLAAALAFCFGAYSAWEKEDRALKDEKAKNGLPLLHGEAKVVFWEFWKDPHSGSAKPADTQYYVLFSLVNRTNVQCTLKNFQMRVIRKDGTVRSSSSSNFNICGDLEHNSPFGDSAQRTNPLAPFKTPVGPMPVSGGHPLTRGVEQSGWIKFYVKDNVPPVDQSGCGEEDYFFQITDSLGGDHEINAGRMKVCMGRLAER